MSDDPKMPPAHTPESASATAGAGQAPPQFAMDSSALSTIYTNFCHVTFTPEELILDFGLNTQTPPSPTQPIKLTHRVVMNFYTAKRLMNGLHFAVSRFESLFGPLELDFQKRMRSMPGGPVNVPRPGL
jgi:hypothetical protein